MNIPVAPLPIQKGTQAEESKVAERVKRQLEAECSCSSCQSSAVLKAGVDHTFCLPTKRVADRGSWSARHEKAKELKPRAGHL